MRAKTTQEYIPHYLDRDCPDKFKTMRVAAPSILSRLANALFPIALIEYRGRIESLASMLGISGATYLRHSKPSGDSRLSLPIVLRAENIVARQIAELIAIQTALADRRKALESRQSVRPGFHVVRVRDSSGIPRNARGHGNGNAPGF